MRTAFLSIITVVCIVLAGQAFGAPVVVESGQVAEGTFRYWLRTPANADDLGLSIYRKGMVIESMAYRVRDRKSRDRLFFARVRFSTVDSPQAVSDYYRDELGKGADQSINPQTKEISLARGTKNDVTIVVIAPNNGYTRVRLERIRRFPTPPRVYTEAEQRVIRFINQVADTYRNACSVSYTMAQSVESLEPGADKDDTPTLVWTVSFTRPATLSVEAKSDDVLGLRIRTEKDTLIITRPQMTDEKIPIGKEITLEMVPQMQGDPVATLMFGGNLLTEVDYLTLSAVPGGKQMQICLTYPESNEAQTLFIDMATKTIVRQEIVPLAGTRNARFVRTYSNVAIKALTPDNPATPPSQPTPQPTASTAVKDNEPG